MDHDAAAIRSAFSSCNLEVADDAVGVCISICGDFGLTADELVAQWDAYSMNHQVTGAADVDKLAGFRSKLAQQRASKPKDTAVANAPASQKRRANKLSGTPVIKREIKAEENKLDALYTMKSPEPKHPRSFASPPGSSNKVQRTTGMFSPSYVFSFAFCGWMLNTMKASLTLRLGIALTARFSLHPATRTRSGRMLAKRSRSSTPI